MPLSIVVLSEFKSFKALSISWRDLEGVAVGVGVTCVVTSGFFVVVTEDGEAVGFLEIHRAIRPTMAIISIIHTAP